MFERLSLKNPVSVYWNIIYLLRWCLTLVIMVFLTDHYSLQILSILFVSYLYQIVALWGKPFIEPSENTWVAVNEVLVDVYLYTMVTLSGNSVVEQSVRINMGWTLLSIIFISFTLNFFKMMYLMIRECRHVWKVRQARKAYELSQS